jgi:hypothetical protein
MLNMGRAARFACVIALLAVGCSSSKPKGNGTGTTGGGPFANAASNPTGKAGNSSTGTGVGGGSVVGNGKCAEGTAHGSHQTPRVVLLVDGSCSMSSNYPSTGRDANSCMDNPNGRWAAIRNALIAPNTGVVATLQTGVEFGLAVFGTAPMCPIPGTPIAPALNNLNAITGGLPQVQPGMFTPTGPALDWVYANMFSATGSAPDTHKGPEILILATDGEPNSCDNATPNFQPSIDSVTKAAAAGLRTYVISLAASSGQFHDFLQQLANIGAGGPAGSTATLYEPTDPAALAADLELLVGGAIGCDLALNGMVLMGRECEGTVTLNGKALACNNPDGWMLPDPRHVRLQGAACNMLKKSPDAMLDAHFPCGIFMVQ